MELIVRPRSGGKTYELMRRSRDTGETIVCRNNAEAMSVYNKAHLRGWDIPPPIGYQEFFHLRGTRGRHRHKGYLIDNLELFLEWMAGEDTPVGAVTLTDAPRMPATWFPDREVPQTRLEHVFNPDEIQRIRAWLDADKTTNP